MLCWRWILFHFFIFFITLLSHKCLENVLIHIFRDSIGITAIFILGNCWIFVNDKVEVIIHCKVIISLLFFLGSLFLFSDFVLELYWAILLINIFSSHSVILRLKNLIIFFFVIISSKLIVVFVIINKFFINFFGFISMRDLYWLHRRFNLLVFILIYIHILIFIFIILVVISIKLSLIIGFITVAFWSLFFLDFFCFWRGIFLLVAVADVWAINLCDFRKFFLWLRYFVSQLLVFLILVLFVISQKLVILEIIHNLFFVLGVNAVGILILLNILVSFLDFFIILNILYNFFLDCRGVILLFFWSFLDLFLSFNNFFLLLRNFFNNLLFASSLLFLGSLLLFTFTFFAFFSWNYWLIIFHVSFK